MTNRLINISRLFFRPNSLRSNEKRWNLLQVERSTCQNAASSSSYAVKGLDNSNEVDSWRGRSIRLRTNWIRRRCQYRNSATYKCCYCRVCLGIWRRCQTRQTWWTSPDRRSLIRTQWCTHGTRRRPERRWTLIETCCAMIISRIHPCRYTCTASRAPPRSKCDNKRDKMYSSTSPAICDPLSNLSLAQLLTCRIGIQIEMFKLSICLPITYRTYC